MESVTQAVSNLALQFGEEDADPGAMVSVIPGSSFHAVLWELGICPLNIPFPAPFFPLLCSHLS